MRLAMSEANRRGGRSGRKNPASSWDLLEYLDDFGAKTRAGEEESRRREVRRPEERKKAAPASVALLRVLFILDLLACLFAILYALLGA